MVHTYTAQLASKNVFIEESDSLLRERKKELKEKKAELDSIVEETEKEEDQLIKKSKKAASIIEERLLSAYHKLRSNARNGLAVVTIQRDSCGGCFNKIPPQRQLDIKQRRKIIVCEHCGRILVDVEIAGEKE
jgi:predicted  nucleic acid-binding Zn-ribbon protein